MEGVAEVGDCFSVCSRVPMPGLYRGRPTASQPEPISSTVGSATTAWITVPCEVDAVDAGGCRSSPNHPRRQLGPAVMSRASMVSSVLLSFCHRNLMPAALGPIDIVACCSLGPVQAARVVQDGLTQCGQSLDQHAALAHALSHDGRRYACCAPPLSAQPTACHTITREVRCTHINNLSKWPWPWPVSMPRCQFVDGAAAAATHPP